MVTIQIDFEVFKALTARRRDESHTENDVIRDLLGLPDASRSRGHQNSKSFQGAWVRKGISFPEGTQFRSTYKGKEHRGTVRNGCLVVNDEIFHTPSGAATGITGHAVNGWTFWECLLQGSDTWIPIAELRGRA